MNLKTREEHISKLSMKKKDEDDDEGEESKFDVSIDLSRGGLTTRQ